jgi:zinc/manganese transport system ATP-binding protein
LSLPGRHIRARSARCRENTSGPDRGREARPQPLAAVGLNGFERRPIETLSAGQFQRVLFARLIAQDAELILLDEPFTSVDWRTSEDLLLLVESWHRERRTALCAASRIASLAAPAQPI